jgi:DNA-binding SARP family transcriptional activator
VSKAIRRRWLANTFPADMPLVLLHPNFPNQHVLVASALNRPGKSPIFISLTNQRFEGRDICSLLTDILSQELGIRVAGLESGLSADKCVQSLLKGLQPIGAFTFIIDDFDLADQYTQDFVVSLVNSLPKGSQVVLGGRHLPAELLTNPGLQGKAQFFPVDPDRMLVDYLDQPSELALLEVYGLGPGRALINGRPIDRWDGMLPRSLFFYLIDRGMVTRDEIFTTFWPNLSVREATNVFHVTKRKISEILGFDLTVYWSGFYRLSPDVQLHYDVVKFAENVQNSAVQGDNEAINMLEQAIYLYRGPFLSMLDMDWAKNRREELELTYADALSSLGKLRQRQGETGEALGLYMRASRTQPQREDLARGIMLLFAELGQPDRALEVYNQLASELKRSLGVGPDRQTVELSEQIQRG